MSTAYEAEHGVEANMGGSEALHGLIREDPDALLLVFSAWLV